MTKTPDQTINEKNFGLSEDKFKQMQQELKHGKDSLFERIFLNHFSSCIDYLKFNKNLSHEDAYDTSMDTMLEFRMHLIAEKIEYGNLRFLFTRMAVQRFLKTKKRGEKIETTDELPEMLELAQSYSDEDLGILELAWNKLNADCKELLKRFYYDNVKLTDLALILGKNASTLRKQKERCTNTLRMNFKASL